MLAMGVGSMNCYWQDVRRMRRRRAVVVWQLERWDIFFILLFKLFV
jgi:hypothetical protein